MQPSTENPVIREVVLDQRLHSPVLTSRVEVRRIQILPGIGGGLHVHNSPVFGVIVEGSAVYQIDGEPESVLGVGDVFYEPAKVRIARFDATAEGVTFFGYFLLEDAQESELTILE